MSSRMAWVALALVAPALVGLAGCAASPPEGLPAGIDVSVHQNRPDTEDRRLQVRISNDSSEPLTVTTLTFSSPRFAEPMAYGKAPTTIRAGGTLDLPVDLASPVCGEEDGTPRVQLQFEHGDGHAGRATITPDDPLDQLRGITERDCLEDAMTAIAEIREPTELRTELVGGRLVAFVDLQTVPSGASGSFTIESVDDTVLFGLFDPSSAAPLDSLPLGLTVTADDDPAQLTIPLVPARCDAHAVAEDKRGTLLPLRVRVGDVAGIRYFALSDDRKGELYAYLEDACADR